MTRMPCGCSTDEPTVCLAHALPSNTCDHSPDALDGRFVSICCTAYALGDEVHEDKAAGILPTGMCGACHDHAVFAVECATCGEIVEREYAK